MPHPLDAAGDSWSLPCGARAGADGGDSVFDLQMASNAGVDSVAVGFSLDTSAQKKAINIIFARLLGAHEKDAWGV